MSVRDGVACWVWILSEPESLFVHCIPLLCSLHILIDLRNHLELVKSVRQAAHPKRALEMGM